MADTRDLVQVGPEEAERPPGLTKMREHSVDFPKETIKTSEMRRMRRRAFAEVPAPSGPQPRAKAIKAVVPTREDFNKLRAVHESPAATAELVAQELDAESVLGITYSAIIAYEYSRMKSEYERRLRSSKQRRRVEARWQEIAEAATQAMNKAGLRGVTADDLDRVATQLTRSEANFNAVVEIVNSARDEVVVEASGIASPKGNFATIYDRFDDLWEIVIPTPPDLCERPIQGSYTKHFSWSFSLSVRITVWCPTWTNPFRTCEKTFTLAGVSVSIGLNVGYRITCCGAVAWGQGFAQACGTIVGITLCASCSATIVGVAGVGRTGSGSTCNYGLGVVAELKCSYAGVTVFTASVPFGWTITGPCPPPGLPC